MFLGNLSTYESRQNKNQKNKILFKYRPPYQSYFRHYKNDKKLIIKANDND